MINLCKLSGALKTCHYYRSNLIFYRMIRRDFSRIVGLNALALQAFPFSASAEILYGEKRSSSKVPLGLCNHSLRSMRLNAQQLIEYAVDQRLDSVLLNTFQPFETLETSHLSNLHERATNNDVTIFVGVGSISEKSTAFSPLYGNAESLLIEGIRVASALGSPIVACRIGSIEDRFSEGGIEAHIEAVIKVMTATRSRAKDAGIRFAFENHMADLRSDELLALINETGTDICGALFDPANALWAMEDPMQALKVLGSNIICTSVRDVAIWESEEGAVFQGTTIGKGIMDYPRFTDTLSRLCPGVPLHVETISNSARSIPYLTAEFWKGFPKLHAAEIMDFLNLVKDGIPLEIAVPPAGMNQKQLDIKLQQSELLNSLKFLRDHCNAGLKN